LNKLTSGDAGLNSKGYNIAIDTIHQTLIGYYEDFVNDDRTEESNLKRVKDKFFESALIENVLLSTPINTVEPQIKHFSNSNILILPFVTSDVNFNISLEV